jgi:hypothetical protein
MKRVGHHLDQAVRKTGKAISNLFDDDDDDGDDDD